MLHMWKWEINILQCIRLCYQWGQLCEWLHNEGALGFGVGERVVEPRMFEMPGGERIRGMGALKDVEEGEILMSIPIYCTMIADEVRTCS